MITFETGRIDPRPVDLQQHDLPRRQQALQDLIQGAWRETDDLAKMVEGNTDRPRLRYQRRKVVGGRGIVGGHMFQPFPKGLHKVCMILSVTCRQIMPFGMRNFCVDGTMCRNKNMER